jgi:membrane-associated protein
VFAASGQLHIGELMMIVPLCAIVGDQIGYWIGRQAGQALYRREDSLIFRKRHLQRAHDFYEKYGGKTIILARFIPVVRTFCPPVAGAALMPYGRYFTYDVAGGFLWVGSMILGGYFLGLKIPNISQNIHYVIAGVIFLSLLPPAISLLRARNSGTRDASTIGQSSTSERD